MPKIVAGGWWRGPGGNRPQLCQHILSHADHKIDRSQASFILGIVSRGSTSGCVIHLSNIPKYKSLLRLAGSILMDINEESITGKRYLFMDEE